MMSSSSTEIWSILLRMYIQGTYTLQGEGVAHSAPPTPSPHLYLFPSTTSMRSSEVASHRRVMSALWIRYSDRMLRTLSMLSDDCGTAHVRLSPPLSFLLYEMFGGVLFRRRPNPSNSFSRILLCCNGFSTSNTMKMRLHVRATAITCRPRPFPSFAPSMIPGRSSSCKGQRSMVECASGGGSGHTWTFAPLYLMTPGTVVRVVNSYAATSEYTPAKLVRSVDFPTEGNPV